MRVERLKGSEERAIERSWLRRLAGDRFFDRGKQYAEWGLVIELPEAEEEGEALVAGTRTYRAGLRREAEQILFHCDCPVGQSGQFCKHVVAIGLSRRNSGRKPVQVCEKVLEQAIILLGGSEPDPVGQMWRDRVLAMLDDLPANGYARKLLDLIESALDQMAEIRWERFEDHAAASNRRQFAKELCDRQVAASRIARPRAKTAAERLLRWELRQVGEGFDAGWISEMLETGYTAVFGEEWRVIFRDLVERHWGALARIEDRRLTLAERRQRDWLARRKEDGLSPECGNCKQVADREEDLIELAWREFTREPSRSQFRQLKECATLRSEWPEWRQRAFEHLRDRGSHAVKPAAEWGKRSRRIESDPDHSELIQIWLEEGEVEEAWRAALVGGCSEELWRKLAALRIRRQPEDALAVYRRLIEKKLQQKNLYAYGEAERLLRRTRRLLKRLGREEDFDPYLQGLWMSYGRQRHLAAFLKQMEK